MNKTPGHFKLRFKLQMRTRNIEINQQLYSQLSIFVLFINLDNFYFLICSTTPSGDIITRVNGLLWSLEGQKTEFKFLILEILLTSIFKQKK